MEGSKKQVLYSIHVIRYMAFVMQFDFHHFQFFQFEYYPLKKTQNRPS